MKNSENAARAASSIAMLSGRHCRTSGKDAHTQRNPSSNSSSTRILQVHHSPLQNGVTRLVPTVRTAEALEEDVGVQLFDRTGAHITLTAAGQVLLNYCEVVKTLLGQAKHELAALSGEHAGQLALGASTTIAQYVLPRLLGEFRREHPRVHPTLISGNTEHIVEAVEEQKIALGFIEGPARSREVKTQSFVCPEE